MQNNRLSISIRFTSRCNYFDTDWSGTTFQRATVIYLHSVSPWHPWTCASSDQLPSRSAQSHTSNCWWQRCPRLSVCLPYCSVSFRIIRVIQRIRDEFARNDAQRVSVRQQPDGWRPVGVSVGPGSDGELARNPVQSSSAAAEARRRTSSGAGDD